LANSQLDQPPDAVLGGLPLLAVLAELRTGLQSPGLLDQAFLRMDHHHPTLAQTGSRARLAQQALVTHCPLELKRPLGDRSTIAILVGATGDRRVGHLSRWTGARPLGPGDQGPGFEIDQECLLGELALVVWVGDPRYQFAPGLLEDLTRGAIPKGTARPVTVEWTWID
jgi:hypothetical protein